MVGDGLRLSGAYLLEFFRAIYGTWVGFYLLLLYSFGFGVTSSRMGWFFCLFSLFVSTFWVKAVQVIY